MPAPFLLRVRPLSSTLICLPTPSTVKGAINHRLNGTGLRTETSWVARTLSFLPYHVHILSYMLGWRKACFQAQWRGLMNGIFPPQEGNEDFLLASSSITVRGTWTWTHSSKSGHLVTADPAEDHSQDPIIHIHGPFLYFSPFKMVQFLKRKTNIAHLNVLICVPDNISEVLINHVFSGDDFLCFGFIKSFFSVWCLITFLHELLPEDNVLSDDHYALLAGWCF